MLVRFTELGGRCLTPRVDVDQENWAAINQWIDHVLDGLEKSSLDLRQDYLQMDLMLQAQKGYNRNRPFHATLKVRA